MNLSIVIFLAGIAMLALLLWYFGTDSDKRKRNVGTLLAIFLSAFCAFGIFYTGHLPDAYEIFLRLKDDAGDPPASISESQRATAKRIVENALSTNGDAEQSEEGSSFAIGAAQNTLFISRPDLSEAEVSAAAKKVEEETGLQASIVADPKPRTTIKRGIDLQGGSAFVVEIGRQSPDAVVTDGMMNQAISVFEQRLNESGTKDLLIATQGENRVMIQMPGVKPEEIESIRTQIQQVAKLEFRLVSPDSDQLIAGKAGPDDVILQPGWVELPMRENAGEEGRTIVVRNRADVEGQHVTRAGASYGPSGWEINLTFNSTGAELFGDLTTANVRGRVAVVLDDVVLSAPRINEPITGGNVQITGDFSLEEATSLASALENPLQVKPEIVDERSVSATYGSNTIKQGVYAAIIGLSITLVVVIIYYRIAGLVALFGLTINMFLLLGCLAMFGFTLTMPGIAGIILTIGISVDANVLIYERLREELRAGKSLGAAISAAYDKAFSAIFDANITTLITATILFMVASGSVKGFAITLTIGILASLFSALLVTRVCFRWLADLGLMKSLRLMNWIPEGQFDFLGKRRLAAMVSLALIAGTIGVFGVKQDDSVGVDFLGGDLITLQGGDDISEDQVRDSLSDIGFEIFTQSQSTPGGDRFITVRTEFKRSQAVLDELEQDLNRTFPNVEVESVGPVVGKELAQSSILALALGLVGILAYVTFRFEFSFAIAAIIALVHDVVICLGIVAAMGYQLQLIHVGAFLTIAGYSINDTIIVFDRIRETLRMKRGDPAAIMNLAISATLSRTLLTSGTTLITMITLVVFGGPSLRDFAVAIMIGIAVGTYSSIFVASPVVLWWSKRTGRNLRREILDADAAKVIEKSAVEREVPGGEFRT